METSLLTNQSRIAISLILFLSASGEILAQSSPQPQPITLTATSLAKNLYLIHPPPDSEDGNVVALCSTNGILLSDTGLSRAVTALQTAISSLPCPNHNVKFVINTHWHLDHAGGNRVFASGGAVIVGHDETRRFMSSTQKLMGSTIQAYPEIARPGITFSDRITVHLDEVEVQADHCDSAHTGGDAIVTFAGARVIHIGDVYYGAVFPWVDADHGGSILGLRKALEQLLQQPDPTIFVPGHGDPIGKAELKTTARMMDESFQVVRQGISQGLTLQQIQQQGLSKEWQSWAWEGRSVPAWIEAVYGEMMKK